MAPLEEPVDDPFAAPVIGRRAWPATPPVPPRRGLVQLASAHPEPALPTSTPPRGRRAAEDRSDDLDTGPDAFANHSEQSAPATPRRGLPLADIDAAAQSLRRAALPTGVPRSAASPTTPVRPLRTIELPPPIRKAADLRETEVVEPWRVRLLAPVRARLQRRPPARPAARYAAEPPPRRHGLPLIAAVGVLVLALLGIGVYVTGRGTATASNTVASTTAVAVPRAVTLAPGAGRPADLKTWLETKGFSCAVEGSSGVEGYLCLLSGQNQTTAYVGGSASGLGRVTMMTPYDPSAISLEVQEKLLTAALADQAEVELAKATLVNGTLERPASTTIGSLTVKGSTGRQLVISVDGWPGRAAQSFGLTDTRLTTLATDAGYTCAQQTGVIDCTRSIGQMQLILSGYTGVDQLRYVRIRVTGTDRTVVQQALVAEATSLLPAMADQRLAETFRVQAASGTAFAFSGAYLLDYYPATTSGNTVRTTLYIGQTCWTGNALTC